MLFIPFPTKEQIASCQISSVANAADKHRNTTQLSSEHAKLKALSTRHLYERNAMFRRHQRELLNLQMDFYDAHDPEYVEYREASGRTWQSSFLDPLVPEGRYILPGGNVSEDRTDMMDRPNALPDTKLSLNELNMQFGNESTELRSRMVREWEDLLLEQDQERMPVWQSMKRRGMDRSRPQANHISEPVKDTASSTQQQNIPDTTTKGLKSALKQVTWSKEK